MREWNDWPTGKDHLGRIVAGRKANRGFRAPQLIAEHTGQPLDKVAKDTDRGFILTAEGAVEYGVVDEVITSRKITPELAAAGRSQRRFPAMNHVGSSAMRLPRRPARSSSSACLVQIKTMLLRRERNSVEGCWPWQGPRKATIQLTRQARMN
ncbi:MAG: ClpP family protease [Actinomycetota bacterium]